MNRPTSVLSSIWIWPADGRRNRPEYSSPHRKPPCGAARTDLAEGPQPSGSGPTAGAWSCRPRERSGIDARRVLVRRGSIRRAERAVGNRHPMLPACVVRFQQQQGSGAQRGWSRLSLNSHHPRSFALCLRRPPCWMNVDPERRLPWRRYVVCMECNKRDGIPWTGDPAPAPVGRRSSVPSTLRGVRAAIGRCRAATPVLHTFRRDHTGPHVGSTTGTRQRQYVRPRVSGDGRDSATAITAPNSPG